MADDQVSIELLAKVDGLTSGLTEAVNAIREAVEAIKGDVHSLEETGEESEGFLKKIGEDTGFIAFKEKAEAAIEAVKASLEALKEGFESTIGKAEEFGLSNAKFAAMMGTSETEAAGLSAALRGVGSSAEEFESMALRMGQKLNTNEASFRQLGIATRDSNGELLSGKALIDSAISTMETYKSGTDQNAFALEVFGRRAADVYNIMRVGDDDVQRQIEIYRSMGVELEGAGEASEKLESVENDLRTTFDALAIKIGQDLMPVAQEFIGWLQRDGKETFRAIADLVVTLVKDLASLLEILGDVYDSFVSVSKGLAATGAAEQGFDASGIQDAADTAQALGQQADGASTKVGGLRKALADLAESVKAGLAESDEKNKPFRMFDEEGTPNSLQRPTENPFVHEGGTRSFKAPTKGSGGPDQVDEERIKAEEKRALALEQIEQEANTHLLAMGQETAAEFVAQATALENETYAIKLAALQKELALPGQTKVARQKINDEILQLEIEHQGALTKIAQDGESKRAALAKATLAEFIKTDDERLKAAMASLQEEAAAGQITNGRRIALEIELTNVVRREELARVDAMLAALKPGTAAYEELEKQREGIEKRFTALTKSENAERRKDIETSVHQWVEPMTSGFKTAFNDMALHGKSFGDSMKAMAQGMADNFINMIENMAAKWVETQITNSIIATTTAQTTAASQISANAGVAASGAAASQAGIPVVGPGLAIAAGAAMLAFVLGYEALAHAEGGMLVDNDRLVFLHKEEMVLPAPLAKGVQGLISGTSGAQAQVGAPTFNFNVGGITSQQPNLETMLRDQGSAMLAWIAQKQRDGAFKGGR